MATKYVCDGCDTEFNHKTNNLNEVSITYNVPGDPHANNPDVDLDLCNNCFGHFKNHIKHLREDRVAAA